MVQTLWCLDVTEVNLQTAKTQHNVHNAPAVLNGCIVSKCVRAVSEVKRCVGSLGTVHTDVNMHK